MKKYSNKLIIMLLLIFALLLSACASSNTSFEANYAESQGAGSIDQVAGDGFSSITVPTASDRILIKDASLSLVVNDPVVAIQQIASMAEQLGGFVVSSNLSSTYALNEQEVPTGDITIRVPSENFAEILATLENNAIDVQNKSVNGKDVTLEYTDLESRLRNLENAAEQLRIVMAEAHRTEDVLAVYSQLTQVTEQAEIVRGQLQYFAESAAFSAISVNLVAESTIQPITVAGWEPGGVARDAIQALINTLQVLTTLLIWVGLYIVPVLLVFPLPIYLIYRFVQSRLKLRPAAGDIPPTNEQ